MFVSRPNTISSLSDIELLEKYRSSGDLELLGILYEKYIHLVYGVSLKYLKDPEECKDVTMSVFEKIVTELEKHEVTNFKSWLYVLTKNFCLMKLRSAKNTEVPRSLEINFENAMESDGPLHHEDKLEDDLILLESCIEELKDEQKISVQLFLYRAEVLSGYSVLHRV